MRLKDTIFAIFALSAGFNCSRSIPAPTDPYADSVLFRIRARWRNNPSVPFNSPVCVCYTISCGGREVHFPSSRTEPLIAVSGGEFVRRGVPGCSRLDYIITAGAMASQTECVYNPDVQERANVSPDRRIAEIMLDCVNAEDAVLRAPPTRENRVICPPFPAGHVCSNDPR